MAIVRSYTVVGTGAVGGFYGARLAAAGHVVRFLGWSDVNVLRRSGIRVTSSDGVLAVDRVEAYDDPAEVPASDVVLVAVKATLPNPAAAVLAQLDGGETPTSRRRPPAARWEAACASSPSTGPHPAGSSTWWAAR